MLWSGYIAGFGVEGGDGVEAKQGVVKLDRGELRGMWELEEA